MKRSRTTIIGIACGLACAACVFAYAQGVRGEADACLLYTSDAADE